MGLLIKYYGNKIVKMQQANYTAELARTQQLVQQSQSNQGASSQIPPQTTREAQPRVPMQVATASKTPWGFIALGIGDIVIINR